MGGFIVTLMSVALIVAVTGMLSPEGDTKKYVRFVGSLCLLCALAAPIMGILSLGTDSLPNVLFPDSAEGGEYEDIYMNALADGARENAEAALKGKLCESFGLSESSIDVLMSIEYDGKKYSVKEVEVILNNSAVFADPREISAYVNGELGCMCTVVYG
jgi:hypothetical protein